MGNNYIIGIGEKNAKKVYHRASSGILIIEIIYIIDEINEFQNEYVNILYEALEEVKRVKKDGSFTNTVISWQNKEDAIEYNTDFTTVLCCMIKNYVGSLKILLQFKN